MPDPKTIYNLCVTFLAQESTMLALAFIMLILPFVHKQEYTMKILYNAELFFFCFLFMYNFSDELWSLYNVEMLHKFIFLKLNMTYETHFWSIAFIFYMCMSIMMAMLAFSNKELYNLLVMACCEWVFRTSMSADLQYFLYLSMRKIVHVLLFIMNFSFLMYLGFDLSEFCEFLLKSLMIE